MQPRLLAFATPLKEVNHDDDDDDVIKRLTLRSSLPERCDYSYRSLGGQLEDSVADWLFADWNRRFVRAYGIKYIRMCRVYEIVEAGIERVEEKLLSRFYNARRVDHNW